MQRTGRNRPYQAVLSAGARPVELHCAIRKCSSHGNLQVRAPNLLRRWAGFSAHTVKMSRARWLLCSHRAAKPYRFPLKPYDGCLFFLLKLLHLKPSLQGRGLKKSRSLQGEACLRHPQSGMSFYKSTAGIRNTLRENLGFRGVKVAPLSVTFLQVSLCAEMPCVQVEQKAFFELVTQNLAAWGVAGTIAYYLWVKPEQKAEAERRVRSHVGAPLACIPCTYTTSAG